MRKIPILIGILIINTQMGQARITYGKYTPPESPYVTQLTLDIIAQQEASRVISVKERKLRCDAYTVRVHNSIKDYEEKRLFDIYKERPKIMEALKLNTTLILNQLSTSVKENCSKVPGEEYKKTLDKIEKTLLETKGEI